MNRERLTNVMQRQKRTLATDTMYVLVVSSSVIASVAGLSRTLG